MSQAITRVWASSNRGRPKTSKTFQDVFRQSMPETSSNRDWARSQKLARSFSAATSRFCRPEAQSAANWSMRAARELCLATPD